MKLTFLSLLLVPLAFATPIADSFSILPHERPCWPSTEPRILLQLGNKYDHGETITLGSQLRHGVCNSIYEAEIMETRFRPDSDKTCEYPTGPLNPFPDSAWVKVFKIMAGYYQDDVCCFFYKRMDCGSRDGDLMFDVVQRYQGVQYSLMKLQDMAKARSWKCYRACGNPAKKLEKVMKDNWGITPRN